MITKKNIQQVRKKIYKKSWCWLSMIAVIVLLVFLVGLISLGPKKYNSESGYGMPPKNCQKNPNPVFTANFTDIDKIVALNPLGLINAGSPGRAYVRVKTDSEKIQKIPVYMPTDATLEGIVLARRNIDDPNSPGEYRLEFRVSCEVTFFYDHINEVVEKIKAIEPDKVSNYTGDLKRVSLSLKAGELIAYSYSSNFSGGFDFALFNKSKEVRHINPDRWEWEQTKYADCPYDYFADNLKEKYYTMFRAADGMNLSVKGCGSSSNDIAGTPSGGWFDSKDSKDVKGKWLEIGNKNNKTEINIRQDGKSFFSIRDYLTTPFPDKVSLGQSVCYSDSNKWAFVRLDSGTQLSLVKGEGTCPGSFPGNNVEIWER